MSSIVTLVETKAPKSVRDEEQVIKGKLGAVAFEVRPRSSGISVEYRGLPADLLAIGAIEPFMAESPKRRGGAAQYDSNGNRWQRRILPSGKLMARRSTKTRAEARQLPGVPPDVSTEVIDWLDQHPGEVHTESCPTTDGGHAWIDYCGTPAALDAAGIVSGHECLTYMLLDGYQHRSNCVPIRPERKSEEHASADEWKDEHRSMLETMLGGVLGHASLAFWRGEQLGRVKESPFRLAESDIQRIAGMVEAFQQELLGAFDAARVLDKRREHLRLVVDNTKGGNIQA